MRIGSWKIEHIVGILLTCFFVALPFERIGGFDVAGVTIRLSQLIALALISFLFIQIALKKKRTLIFPWPLVLYVCYLGAAALSLWNTQSISHSIMVWLLHLFMLFVALFLTNEIGDKRTVRRLIQILLGVSLVVTLLGFFQFAGDLVGLPQSITGLSDRYVGTVIGIPRIQSTFIEPLYFANFLLIPLSLSVSLLFADPQNKKKYFVLAFLFLIALVLTISKGGILAAGVSLLVVVALMFRRLVTPQSIAYICGALLLVAAVAWSGFAVANRQADLATYIKKAQEVVLGGGSILERQEAYTLAWQAFTTRPTLGIGVGSFGGYYSGYLTQPPDYGWPIVNNEYLEVLAETGIVGAVFFLAFLISLIAFSLRALRLAQDPIGEGLIVGCLAALVGALVQYTTFSTLYIMHIWALIGLLLVLGILYGNKTHEKHHIF